jgi:hypothetical protein
MVASSDVSVKTVLHVTKASVQADWHADSQILANPRILFSFSISTGATAVPAALAFRGVG